MTTERERMTANRKDTQPEPTKKPLMLEEVIHHKPSVKEFERLVHLVLKNAQEETLVG